jgi:D-alanine-D-alanine ligase
MIERSARVAVLMGGMSAEREVSLWSGAAVARALRRRGWDTVEIDVGRDLPARLVAERVDVCWIALHGKYGEDGCVQGLLEIMGVPYTGSGVRASAVAMDKISTKRVISTIPGVPMARDWVARRGQPLPDGVVFPAFVKPAGGGSSLASRRVDGPDELAAAVADALVLDPEVLIEELLVGDEITVVMLDGRSLPVIRIVPLGGATFDFDAKYVKGKTYYEVPAKIAEASEVAARRCAELAYAAVGCRGLSRVDFIVRASDGVPVLLEVNTIPGMTETSLSPMAAGTEGMSFDDLVEHLLLAATVGT